MLARVASSFLFFALLLFGLYSGKSFAPHVVLAIVAGATWIGTREYYLLARRRKMRPSPWPGGVAALAYLADAYFLEFEHFVHIFIVCFWILLLTQVFFKRLERSLANTAVSLFGSVYVGLPLAVALYVFRHGASAWGLAYEHAGSNLLMFLILTAWATDIGGYCIGKPLGRHKLTPVLSPNKSIEGLVGGGALAVASGLLLRWLWPHMDEMISWGEAVLLPLAFTAIGTVGDLAESAFKRDAGVKDSGKTYTGHGGMLDVLDSLLLCAPVFYLYLELRYG